MYKNLYNNFAHWFHDSRGTVYFYSDPHFNDPEMVHLRKNYIGDEEQIKRINSKIGRYDTLVVLGDVGDIEWVRKIRGYKVLVMGNHDAGATNYKRKTHTEYYDARKFGKETAFADAKTKYKNWNIQMEYDPGLLYPMWMAHCDNGLFDEVYEGALMIAPNIILSHEPVNFPFAVNIHGHNHSNDGSGGINVCAEHIDYTPVPLKYLVEKGMLKAPNIHREAIDKAVDRKTKKVKAKEFKTPITKSKPKQKPQPEYDDDDDNNMCRQAYWL